MPKRTTSVQLTDQALENIEQIKARYGVSTMAAAINLALQETARVAKAETRAKATPAAMWLDDMNNP